MPPERIHRRLAAILATDAVGFSRLMGADEEGTLARMIELRSVVVDPAIAQHRGRIFKTTGDGLLAEFPSVVEAVHCAAAVQTAMFSRSAAEPPERRIVFRIGVNLGDIMVEGDDIYGDGVNIAARLESICEPGGAALSASAYEQVRDKVAYRFVDRGEHTVKNIARPIRVWAMDLTANAAAEPRGGRAPSRRLRPWLAVSVTASALLITAAIAFMASPDFAKAVRSAVPALFAGKPGDAASSRATIAVMPFSNQSGDATRDYFSDGITEDIINALGRFSGVMVIARNAVQEYKGRNATREEVNREFGVRYIVQGSVRQVDGKLRVAVELSDAEKGVLLWSDRFEGEGKDVFDIQDRIVRNIVGVLAVKLTRLEQQRVFTKPTDNLEAYDLVLRARELINRTERSANREAREILAKAAELAPNYAETYLTLAEAEYQRATIGWMEDVEAGVRRSQQHAKRALALDDPGARAHAHALLGRAYSFFLDFDRALAEADRAIELNPSDAVAYDLRGSVLLWLGRLEESVRSIETALRFDPRLGVDTGFGLATAYYLLERYRDSLAVADRFVARYPKAPALHEIRAATLAQMGDMEQARAAAEQVRRIEPFFRVELFGTRFVRPEHQAKAQEGLRKAGL